MPHLFRKVRVLFLYLSASTFLIPFASFGLGRALTTIPLGIAIIGSIIGGDIKGAFHYLKTNKFIIPIILLPMMMYIGVFYTPEIDKANGLGIASKYHWLIFPLLLSPMLIKIYNQKKWQLLAYHFFIFGAIIVSLIGIFSVFNLRFFDWVIQFSPYQGGYNRSSPLQSHTETGFIVSLGAYFCFTLFAKFTKKVWFKIIYFLIWLLLSYYIFFINTSKTGPLLYFILTAVFVFQYFIKNWKHVFFATICLLMVISGTLYLSNYTKIRLDRLYTSVISVDTTAKVTSFGQRLIMAKLAYRQFKKAPIIGSGTGTPIDGRSDHIDNPRFKTTDPHSEYLFVLTKLGLIGLFLLMLYFGFMVYDSLFVIRKGIEANLAFGISISFIFYAFVESILYHNPASYEVAFFVSLFFLSKLD